MSSNDAYRNDHDQGTHDSKELPEAITHGVDDPHGEEIANQSKHHSQHGPSNSKGPEGPETNEGHFSAIGGIAAGATLPPTTSTKFIAHPDPQAPQRPVFPLGSGPPESITAAVLHPQRRGAPFPGHSHSTPLGLVPKDPNSRPPMDARMEWHMLWAQSHRRSPPPRTQHPPDSNAYPSSGVSDGDINPTGSSNSSSPSPTSSPDLAAPISHPYESQDHHPLPDSGERLASSSSPLLPSK